MYIGIRYTFIWSQKFFRKKPRVVEDIEGVLKDKNEICRLVKEIKLFGLLNL